MSGPKVVTIVTREEIIDTCVALIAALKSAVERWETAASRSGAVSDDEIAASRRRISEIQTFLEDDRFMEVQKRVPKEIAFLDSDIETIAQKAAIVSAAARERARRSIAAAEILRSELSQRGLEVPSVLSRPEDHPQSQVEAAVAEAFASLAPAARAPLTASERQMELASFHAAGESRQTLADWMTNVRVGNSNPLVVSLQEKLDQLRVLDPHEFDRLSEKLPEIAAENASARQTLLADSLTLDIATARRSALELLKARSALETLHAEARALNYGTSSELTSEIETALGDNEVEAATLAARSSAFKQTLSRLKDEKVSQQRRKVLLDGLAELGYAVQEGMETAWVENGRVVLTGGNKAAYGIEIGGNPEVALQLRTVAFNSLDTRSAQEDIAAEEGFCGEFSALRENLLARGGELKVVKSLGIGQSRVKQADGVKFETTAETSGLDVGSARSLSVLR